MPTQATIQSKIYKGYGKAALRLGASFNFYRPAAAPYLLAENGLILTGEDGGSLIADVPQPLLAEGGQALMAETGQALLSDTPVNYGMSPVAGTPYATQLVSLNAEDMGYKRPNKYGKPTWFALFDATGAEVGDYLISAGEPLLSESGQPLLAENGQILRADMSPYKRSTFFVAALQPLLPILVVECNRTIDVVRSASISGVGAVGYGGRTAATDTVTMGQWPASILQGTKGEKDEVGLPGDTRTPWWSVLLPAYLGVVLRASDRINDDLGRSYTISSAELTDLGWRLTCQQAVT